MFKPDDKNIYRLPYMQQQAVSRVMPEPGNIRHVERGEKPEDDKHDQKMIATALHKPFLYGVLQQKSNEMIIDGN
ncbi:hypothetical protein FHS19_003150 [Paenibacillus rhizosphaerae]|uniref:Uncharacterized protein n=1 Tax=Paenibacillus rhizosphaerae TaxID=297318 RepID=A0A839TNW8_9BACL|nr:hypothetical protein [Paenibacillus rhizosphaerae]MBB3128496.1 hypothetical protein [Paenibacillus rhizosphaerae]